MVSWLARRFKNKGRGAKGVYLPKEGNASYVAGVVCAEWNAGAKRGLSIVAAEGPRPVSWLELPTHSWSDTRWSAAQLPPHCRPPPLRVAPHSATLHRAPRPSPIYIRASRFSSRFADPAEREHAHYTMRAVAARFSTRFFNFEIIRYVYARVMVIKIIMVVVKIVLFV